LAVLKEVNSQQRMTLRAWHVVGRASSCHLRLDDRRVSGEHAVICWTGQSWILRDLRSRNGTRVDGQVAEPGTPLPLGVGAQICFGSAKTTWELVSVDPPVAMATGPSGGPPVMATFGLLALPDSDNMEVSVYMDASGRWVAEHGDEVTPVADQEVLVLSDGPWVLDLPESVDETWDTSADMAPQLEEIGLDFSVSRDQEYVEVNVLAGGRQLALRPRADLELLLQLARLRLQDEAAGQLPAAEHGWVYRDELLRMLAISENTLHQRVFRAREQLARVGVDGAAGVVERRLTTGQLRIGVRRLTVREL
jgi:hypothetical protein